MASRHAPQRRSMEDPAVLYIFPRETIDGASTASDLISIARNWHLREQMTGPLTPIEYRGRTGFVVRFDQQHCDRGFIVGSGNDADLVLPPLNGVSQYHLVITFDDENQLILQDQSSYGTRLGYFGDKGEKKINFTWRLRVPGMVNDRLLLEISYRLKFELVLVDHDVESDIYMQQVQLFRSNTNGRVAESECTVSTTESSAAGTPPNALPVYCVRHVGSGTFGHVRLVWAPSTGVSYALKVPVRSNVAEVSMRKRDEEAVKKWNEDAKIMLKKWQKEADIMSKVCHEHIVDFLGIATYEDPGHKDNPDRRVHPGLKFEFAERGTLNEHRDLTRRETVAVLFQLLSALEYLHGFDTPIVHRDIKPQNILVFKRSASGITVKFADFGLAKAGHLLSSVCGTQYYAAPEIRQDSANGTRKTGKYKYSPLVDIFALGLVIAYQECGFGVDTDGASTGTIRPSDGTTRGFTGPVSGITEQESIRRFSQESTSYERQRLLNFVCDHMLEVDPQNRKTAAQCLSLAKIAFPEHAPF